MSVERINSSENSQFTRILCEFIYSSCPRVCLSNRRAVAHATKVPGLIFLSGQTPVDKDGKLVEGGIQEHTV